MAFTSFSNSRLAAIRKTTQVAFLGTTRGRDLAACLSLAILALLFPWQVTFWGYLPSSIDFLLQYFPNLAFLGHSLKTGDFPLWNPYVFAGTPYLADPQSAALYLPNWPFLLLLDTLTAARAIILLHYALAAVSFFLYLRVLSLSTAPSFLGAAIFGFSEYTITQVAGIPLLINLAWIPVVLMLAELTLQRQSLAFAAGAAISLAMQLFNGWLHGLYVAAFALGSTFLYHVVVNLVSARDWKACLKMVGLVPLVGVLWASLSSALLFPALEFVERSCYVMDRGLEQAGGEGNVTVLALLGVGGSEGHGAYIGAIGLGLLLLGALYGRDRKRTYLYLALGGFALLTAFGTKAPLYAQLYHWIPGFKTFHTPGRFMALYLISASTLASFGADVVLKGVSRRQVLTLGGVALLLLIPFYYTMLRMFAPDALGLLANNLIHWGDGPYLRADVAHHIFFFGIAGILFFLLLGTERLTPRYAYSAALLLLLADIFLMRNLGSQYFAPPPGLLGSNPKNAFLLDSEGPKSQELGIPKTRSGTPSTFLEDMKQQEFRVMGYARNGTYHFLSDFPYNLLPTLMPPNLAMVYQLEDVQGYNPLQLRRYAEYIAAINGGPQDYHWALIYNFQSRLLDMLNLRYVMLSGDDTRLKNTTIAMGLNLEDTGRSLTVHPKPIIAAGLQVHSYLGHSADLVDGQVAARLRISDSSGLTHIIDLRAGIETAEWAYDRPDVAARVKHRKATVSMTWNLPSPVHTYVANITFTEPIEIVEVTLERVEPGIFIVVPELSAVPVYPLNRYEEVGNDDLGVKLYRNNLALPRALLVPRATVVQNPSDVLDILAGNSFDPKSEVVLEGPGAPKVGGSSQNVGEVVLTSRSNNKVHLDVRASSPGFLVLNELSYPGWNAYVDGQRTRVWRANYLFRAIEIPAGDHEVEFRFEPDSIKLGLALSLPTLALLLMVAVFRLTSRQHWKEKTSWRLIKNY